MDINFQKYADGLVPVIVQDTRTQRVLMLGFMDAEALELTRSSGWATFYSRSRRSLWRKGETSGNFFEVSEILADCDSDTLLLKVVPHGPGCHSGSDTCFNERNLSNDPLLTLEAVVSDRKAGAFEDSYTATLFRAGINRIAQKVGEEAIELVIEAKDTDNERLKSEAADLIYHLLVLLSAKGISLDAVYDELRSRMRQPAGQMRKISW